MGGITTGTLVEPTNRMEFSFVPPDTVYLTIRIGIPSFVDGDGITITIDSLFSLGDCRTVPVP